MLNISTDGGNLADPTSSNDIGVHAVIVISPFPTHDNV